jgi:hypothetical protein
MDIIAVAFSFWSAGANFSLMLGLSWLLFCGQTVSVGIDEATAAFS